MTKIATVSIVMPAYNVEQYIGECLDSILAQTYTDWELLVVDDFSTDKTLDILQQYAEKDERIGVFQNTEKGIIPALQLAYAHSSGAYITRMDADDRMSVDKLEKMTRVLHVKGQGYVAVGRVRYFSEAELGEGYLKYANWLNELTSTHSNFDEIYKECVIPSPCWMMSRCDFNRCGGFSSMLYPEDYDLVFRMRRGGFEVVGVDKILHEWRDHGDRASRNDSNYSDNAFIPLKVKYFCEDDLDTDKVQVVWGAGRRGKKVVQHMQRLQSQCQWLTNNPQKIGKEIYGITLKSQDLLEDLPPAQVLITVSSPQEQLALRKLIATYQQHEFFWFC